MEKFIHSFKGCACERAIAINHTIKTEGELAPGLVASVVLYLVNIRVKGRDPAECANAELYQRGVGLRGL